MHNRANKHASKSTVKFGALLASSLIGLAGLGGITAAQASNTSDTPDTSLTSVVHTHEGNVQGLAADHVGKFLGIPYAAPPVGDLRWRPPQNVQPWSQTLQATKFANWCAQPNRGTFASPSTTEDCLYLNVFTPDIKPGRSAKRPVMVWFYGGGLFSGESNDYDGTKLAARGGVVLVSLNYRVGALGFFSHPAINTEGHAFANYGIMDQQAALKWVQRNIAAFGGDPKNVTIFGQSGGGTSVLSNLQSPLSKRLFQRAINESGTRIKYTAPETTLKLGVALATAAGCTDQSAACLRSLSIDKIFANQAGIVSVISDFPSADGIVITQAAFPAFAEGNYNKVPILNGLVQDEQAFFMPELNTHVPSKAEDFERYAASFGADNKDRLLKKYPLANYASPSLALIAMAQGSKACTARSLDRQWAKNATVYAYEFRDRTAPSYIPLPSYPMRAYHSSELQFLFPLFKGGQGTAVPLSAEQEQLSDTMVDYWTNFARAGSPNKTAKGKAAPTWARYSPAQDNIQILDLATPRAAQGYGKENDCALWDPVLNWK
jgi:para-nitrobenzyl esterase